MIFLWALVSYNLPLPQVVRISEDMGKGPAVGLAHSRFPVNVKIKS